MSSSPSAAAGAAFDFEQLAPAPHTEAPPTAREAQTRAQSIVAAAHAEADRIRNEARQEGYAEGMVAGRADLRATAEPVVDALSHAIEELRALQLRAADLVEREAVVLA